MTRPLLNFLDYRLERLRFEPESSFSAETPQRARIEASFGVNRDPKELQRFDVVLNVRFYKDNADENVAYIVDCSLMGEFWANVFLTPVGVPALMVMNALSQLYGVARGIIGQATAGGVHGRFVLPSVTFDELVTQATVDPTSNVITDAAHKDLALPEHVTPQARVESSPTERTFRTTAPHYDDLTSSLELVARLRGVLFSLKEFDNAEIRPRIDETADHTYAEECAIGMYLRVLANVRTLVSLKDAGNFQAIAMIARAIFELAVDLALLQRIPDAAERVMAFIRLEKLRAARRIVATAVDTSVEGDNLHQRFIDDHGAEVEAKRQVFWPNQSRPLHWSGMDLRSRTQIVKAPFDSMYDTHYQELSWYVHAGLTGVANLEKYVFPLICGTSYNVAIESYREALRSVIEQFRLHDIDPLIDKKLDLARLLPFTNGPREEAELRRELLGQ